MFLQIPALSFPLSIVFKNMMKKVLFVIFLFRKFIVIINKCICILIQAKLITQKPELTDYLLFLRIRF